jgi:phage-related protein
MKRVRFVGSSKEDMSTFPASARVRAGHELFMLQAGREPTDWKPISEVGAGAREIRVRDETGAFRVICVAKFADAIYVLHAFQKKVQKTAQTDIDLAERRYREAQALAKEASDGKGH